MMVLVSAPTILGGVFYEAGPVPQSVPDNIGEHLIQIGNATKYETKVVEPTVKKTSSASQQGQALPEQTAKKPRGRPRKSS